MPFFLFNTLVAFAAIYFFSHLSFDKESGSAFLNGTSTYDSLTLPYGLMPLQLHGQGCFLRICGHKAGKTGQSHITIVFADSFPLKRVQVYGAGMPCYLDDMQAVKVSGRGKIYFIPRDRMHMLDLFEDFIAALEAVNKNNNPYRFVGCYVRCQYDKGTCLCHHRP